MQGNHTTEHIHDWWLLAQSKGADYIRIIKPGHYYALEACKHGIKARISQVSLATSDKDIALIMRSNLLVSLTTTNPETVVLQYNQHQLRMADCCQARNGHERLHESRIKTAKTNASRLNAHFLPFCNKKGIYDIRDLYKRETVGAYIAFLQETVTGLSTAHAIIKTTKALLNWFDSTQTESLISRDYIEAMSNYSRKLGYKQKTVKPFLTEDQCRRILATDSTDKELRAIIIAHLVGGLRDIEVQGLRWKNLNEKEGWLKVENAKGSVARYAQYPKIMQEAFAVIQKTRLSHILGNDYIFTQSSYGSRNDKIKAFIRSVAGVNGKNYGSNCLRRTGCASIDNACPGLGDKQLGHAVNSRVTEMHYSNPRDFRNVNEFWNNLWIKIKEEGMTTISLSDELTNIVKIPA